MENYEEKYLSYIRENIKTDDKVSNDAISKFYMDQIDFEELTHEINGLGELMSYKTFIKKYKIDKLL